MKFKFGFLHALGLMFIGLKLGHVIDWSWWWVLFPLYGPPLIILGFFTVFAWIIALCDMLFEASKRR